MCDLFGVHVLFGDVEGQRVQEKVSIFGNCRFPDMGMNPFCRGVT